ncbi:HU family DNA-binding protein [Labilibacter marinus]|uniref:HU family DNA-binding protein n=1 Tax=Labilibacter marinus TaxID=1477105 RepID=UPI00082FE92E|nr:HU family DNA-binding protein [Labilibacter marinus]
MIRYTVKELQDPTNRPSTKYYAKPVYEGTVPMSEIERDISSISTLSRADVRATTIALVDKIGDYLLNGYNVKIDELGTFFLRSQSVGKETEKEVRGKDIMKLNIGFKAAPEFKEKLKHNTELRKKRK